MGWVGGRGGIQWKELGLVKWLLQHGSKNIFWVIHYTDRNSIYLKKIYSKFQTLCSLKTGREGGGASVKKIHMFKKSRFQIVYTEPNQNRFNI